MARRLKEDYDCAEAFLRCMGRIGVFIIIKMRNKKSMSWAARGREAPAYLQDVGVVSPPRVRSTGVSTTVTFGHLTGRVGLGPAQ